MFLAFYLGMRLQIDHALTVTLSHRLLTKLAPPPPSDFPLDFKGHFSG